MFIRGGDSIQCQTTNRVGRAICEVLPQVPCCIFSASFSARMCGRSACLESEAVLGASLILHASKSVFYCVLDRAIAYEKNIYIKRVHTMLFAVFAVFPVLEFIAWIICRSQQRRLPARLTIAWDSKRLRSSYIVRERFLVQENRGGIQWQSSEYIKLEWKWRDYWSNLKGFSLLCLKLDQWLILSNILLWMRLAPGDFCARLGSGLQWSRQLSTKGRQRTLCHREM